MKNCLGCKYAGWQKTKAGKLQSGALQMMRFNVGIEPPQVGLD